jgi:peptide-methionine (S)-S-oxide reductase
MKNGVPLGITVIALVALISLGNGVWAGKTVDTRPATEPAKTPYGEQAAQGDENMQESVALFGAGCFWGVEAAFRKMEGVTATAVGYAGGKTENPTYREVCSDRTGHAEVVQVKFDPEKVSYEKLLDAFWKLHDPTQVNRQGPDVGSQYRSVVFYHDEDQKKAAEESKKALEESGAHSKPIATQIEPAPEFYMAEEYHQQYLEKKGLASCHIP